MNTKKKVNENRLRRLANKQGLRIEKSRIRYASLNNQDGYRLIEVYTNTLINGLFYELTLTDIEHFLNEK